MVAVTVPQGWSAMRIAWTASVSACLMTSALTALAIHLVILSGAFHGSISSYSYLAVVFAFLTPFSNGLTRTYAFREADKVVGHIGDPPLREDLQASSVREWTRRWFWGTLAESFFITACFTPYLICIVRTIDR